jgi:acyl-CoA reductase-like NAD-dependent aldehyde dehydrogenase
VSGSISSNHEFHKAEAFVSVSVTCNNNMDDVMNVHALVQPFVKDLVRVDHDEMSLLRDEVLPEGKKLHAAAFEPKGKAVAIPPTIRPPAVPGAPSPSAMQRGATVTVKKPAPKPAFER